jgi:hypothetical protein
VSANTASVTAAGLERATYWFVAEPRCSVFLVLQWFSRSTLTTSRDPRGASIRYTRVCILLRCAHS